MSEVGTSDDHRAASREAGWIGSIYLSDYDNSYLWGSEGPYWLLRDLAKPLWKAGQYEDALTVIEIARAFGRENYSTTDHEKWIHKRIRSKQREFGAERWRWNLAKNGWSLAMGSPEWQKRYARNLGTIAGYMDDLAFSLAVQGRKPEAELKAKKSAATWRQVVDIYWELSAAQPAAFLPYLATSLDTLAAELPKTGDSKDEKEAKAASAEAAALRTGNALTEAGSTL